MNEWIVTGEKLVEETTHLSRLVLEPGSSLKAPEGKFVQLTVNGSGRQITEGTYYGDIVVSVAEEYDMPPQGLMKFMGISAKYHSTAVIESNKLNPAKGVPAVVAAGRITDTEAVGVEISSSEDNFNGIVITGDSDYTVRDSHISFDGHGFNDFIGSGAGVAIVDHGNVTIENTDITMSSVTRCAVHVGGDSIVHVKNCRIENHSPEDTEWMSDFSWAMGVTGSNRLVQLCDDATVYYENCFMKTNGWGVFSIDGCNDSANMYIKDCEVVLDGPNTLGYGAFCIGDRNEVFFDHSKVRVNGYPLMVRGMLSAAHAGFKNGCEVSGNLYGVFCMGDKNTPVEISDSSVVTGSSTIVCKGSATDFHITNSVIKPGNGVVLQLMDSDEGGMDASDIKIPVGIEDTPVEGRDLTSFDPAVDVSVELKDMKVCGDFLNSTTNLHIEKSCSRDIPTTAPAFGGLFVPPEGGPGGPGGPDGPDGDAGVQDHPEEHPDYDAELRGPKNMLIEMKHARVEGVISAATAAYREGVTVINQFNRCEINHITQTPAPVVNNGVIVRMDKDSDWYVTGTCYLTSLEIAPYARLLGVSSKTLVMTVDGVETEIAPGAYTGNIILSLKD